MQIVVYVAVVVAEGVAADIDMDMVKVVVLKLHIPTRSGIEKMVFQEKQKVRVREKIDKCVKEKLVDLCDLLNIPFMRTSVRKDEVTAKLLEFLESPHATTDVLLAEKEQVQMLFLLLRLDAENPDSHRCLGFAESRSFGSSGQIEGIVALTAHRSGLHPGTRYLARGINSCFSTGKMKLLFLSYDYVDMVVAADANLVLTTRGIEKTTRALISELKAISKEVEDSELADIAAVSPGSNNEIGNMIAQSMSKVGRKGVIAFDAGNRNEVSNLHRSNDEPV
ncbi:hypothetical protein PVK06_020249 [Gossypium arboreum]|uniref:Uncharacterized protein n=1 Tax=Gossypium arboreum TaxID=29729 RepID=A0ABR0PLX7_GOSAR|nr:hypothetical protein PVK06_020249 [Gossypium arboreum]